MMPEYVKSWMRLLTKRHTINFGFGTGLCTGPATGGSLHSTRWRRRPRCAGHTRSSLGGRLATELDRLDLIDEYRFLVHPRIAGHGATLFQGRLPSTRRLELLSDAPLTNGAVAMHYRRARSS